MSTTSLGPTSEDAVRELSARSSQTGPPRRSTWHAAPDGHMSALSVVKIYYWPSEHWVDDDAHAAVVAVADAAERDIRHHLPTLEEHLYLLVNQTSHVTPETGDGGFTIGPHCLRWDVDPTRSVGLVAKSALRRTLFHECHHAVRLQRRPEDAGLVDWPSYSRDSHLSSRTQAGSRARHGRNTRLRPSASGRMNCSPDPSARTGRTGKFVHPDGRRNIAYKVGAWIVDQAVQSSRRTAAELVWESPTTILDLAGHARP